MPSATQLMVRTRVWGTLGLGVVALNVLLAYASFRQLDALPNDAVVERSTLVNRAVAFHGAAGLGSVVLLAVVVERVARERQQRQHLLERATHRVARAVTDGVIGLDASGHVRFINEHAAREAGLPSTVILGQPITQVLPMLNPQTGLPADNPALRAMRERCTVVSASPVALARSGGQVPVDAAAAPIMAGDDTVAGAVLVLRDANDRMRSDQAVDWSPSLFSAVLDTPATQVALLERHDDAEMTAGIRAVVDGQRLPVAIGRDTAGSLEPSSPSHGRPAPRRILIVDDNADALDSLAVLLGLDGHDVRVACDGLSALDVARTFEPDVAVLDIGLPGMSGHDVARALRADHRTARCMLVALTGWGQDSDRKRSRESGFDHHLVKPLDIDVLNGLLKQAVDSV